MMSLGQCGTPALVLSITGGIVLLGAQPTDSFGQQVSEGSGLEEVIITARKREESLQDVPIAVSAFTTESIQQLGLVSIDDVARFTPGFSFQSGFGRNSSLDRPTVRGATSILNGVAGTKAVSTFVDGVYVGGLVSSVNLRNVERVEIIKGPQSAQYGRGTYAGAINYVTRRPTDEFTGEVEATGASHDTFGGSAWVSGPLAADRAYFFLSGAYSEYGGEYRNERTGKDVGEEETLDFTGKLYLTPSQNLEITLTAGYQETDDGHWAIGLQGRELNNCCFRTGDPLVDPSATVGPRARGYYDGDARPVGSVNLFTDLLDAADSDGAGNKLERISGSLRLDWTFGGGYTATSLTGYIDDEFVENYDASYAGYDALADIVNFLPPFLQGPLCESAFCGSFIRLGENEQTDFSQELRLSSPGDQSFRWTAGLYYYEGTKDMTRNDKVIPPNEWGVPVGLILNNGLLTEEEVENIAVFGGVEWDINEQWTATLEARWSEDDVSLDTFDETGSPVDGWSETFDSFNPRFTVTYKQNENVNYYLNISKGSKPGFINSQVPATPDGSMPDESFRFVDEEEAWNYELGLKSTLWDDRAAINLAAYFIQAEDQQFTTVIEPFGSTTSASILDNIAETDVLGFEADITTLVTDELTVSLTYSYTDAEIQEHISFDQADLLGSDGSRADVNALGSVAGNQVPRVAEHMASAFARYERPIGGNSWYISGDVTYESSRFSQIHNLIETGDNTYVGLRVGFVTEHWEFTAWGKNIFDDDNPIDLLRYIDRRLGGLPPASVVGESPDSISPAASTSPRGFGITPPRGDQWGVTARYRF